MYEDKAVERIETGLLRAQRITLRERLLNKKSEAEKYLADVNQAIKFMDENPGFESFHDLIGKVGY